jgi:aquaporin Z
MALRSTAEPGQAGAGRTVTLDAALARKASAEFLGTALLVFFGAGVATVAFGFRAFGTSVAAGVLITGLAFGLVLIALVALIGPMSGCHVNPAVTLGVFLAKRIPIVDAVAYWVAQVVGGIVGALVLLWVMHSSPFYTRPRIGLGANGYGRLSLLHSSAGGAFLIEVIITAVFVLVVLTVTGKEASGAGAGVIIGVALALMNIMAIPVDGASVNPARSLGPAVVVGGQALSQVWVFLIAPLVGAVLAAGLHMLFRPAPGGGRRATPGMSRLRAQPAAPSQAGTTAGPASAPATGTSPAGGAPQYGNTAAPDGDEEADTGPVNPPGAGGAGTLLTGQC